MRILLLLISLLLSFTATAQVAKEGQCMRAIQKVSKSLNIPADVLGAVALTETGIRKGKKFTPWPWALNVNGKGYIYKSRDQAFLAARKFLKQGKTSMDLGCMQMNWRWHKNKFGSSVAHALDPVKNVTVAARYLKQHYRKYGNWSKAIGRYHSGTPQYASRYLKKALVNRKIMRRSLGLSPKRYHTTVASLPKRKASKPAAAPKSYRTKNMPQSDKSLITASIDTLRQTGLPSAPSQRGGKFLEMTPGALIAFEHAGKELTALPKAPTMLLRPASGKLINLR